MPLPSAVPLIFALLVLPAIPAYAQPPVHLPTDPSVVHGTATFDTVGNHMTVTNSPNAILDWQDFSIGAGHEVHFQQLNAASQVLNRVTGNDPSQILGSLSSNGGVWLINPHGVLFGQNARIDVAGLVTSALDISNIDFLAGKYNFLGGGGSPGQVTNQGEIKTTFGGRVWLIGEQVRNEGLIQTPGGNIVLAAGKSLELIDSGAPNVIVRVTAPDNEVANLGSLVAASGGNIDVYGSIVNQQGIVRADSVGTDAAGRIVFTASQALNLKESSVTSAQGGTIQMTAGMATYLAGMVDVSQQQGAAGRIQLLTGQMQGTVGGSLRADGMQGGSISIEGRDTVTFSSLLSATGSSHGGTIGITGDRVYIFDAAVDASGGAQGGIVHIGGGWKGGGGLPHARNVFIGSGSEIKANGSLANTNIPGQGGEIVVWSTQSSAHYGLLQAGNGGRIELSSQGEILQGGKLQAGPGGSVLLDPKNLIITDTPPDSLALAQQSVGQPGEQYGFSVALSGDRLAIGAAAAGLNNSGAVYLFTGASSSGFSSPLALYGKLEDPTPAEQFGSSIALSGDLLAVGAPFADRVVGSSPESSLTDSGAVYLYNGVWNVGGLSQQPEKIDEPTLESGDQFGFAVALDQDRLAVGANGVATETGGSQGAVYLYTGAGTSEGPFEQTRILFDNSLSHTSSSAFFGRAVALDGDRLVVGAPKDMVGAAQDGTGGVASGAVYLYTGVGTDFSGLNLESPIRIISPSAVKSENDDFGVAVTLNGSRLAVGAAGEGAGGLVYIYTMASTSFSDPVQQATLGLDPNLGLTSGDRFGYGVSLDGDRLAVGLRGFNNSAGAVDLFTNVIGVGNARFDQSPSATSYISSSSITQLLDAGTAVVLQANNDITVQSPIIAELEGSNGGALSLQAGRNINLNADITTSNGNLSAVAGDSGANSTFTDSGTPTLTINEGVVLNIGSGTATLAAVNGNFINFSGNSAIFTAEGGQWLIYTSNPDSANFGGLSSGNLAFWNQSYTGSTPPGIIGNRYLFGTPQNLTFNTSGSLTKTYGDDVTSSLPTPTITGANSNTYGGAIIADSSVPLSSLFAGTAAVSSAGAAATANVSGSPYAIAVTAGTLSSLTGYGTAFSSTGTITVNPFAVNLNGTRPYDGTESVAANILHIGPLVGSETLALSGSGMMEDKHVGSEKNFTTSGLTLDNGSGLASNYTLSGGTHTVDITPATLLYRATPATGITGAPVNGVTGTIVGLKGTDTLQNDTVGTLLWTTPASAASPAGTYAINGSGLSAKDYFIEPDPANAHALTLLSGIDPVNNPKDKQDTLDTSVQSINVAMLGAFPILDWSTTGFVVDLASMKVPDFGALNLARMSRAEMQQLIDMRREFKEKLFADAIYKLNMDPSLANVPPCPSLADVNTGLCRITDAQRKEHASKAVREEPHKSRRKTKLASLPQIERKVVVLFGIDQYTDKTIPPLENAIFDAEVVGKLFADKLGYEVNVVKNATKADIVRTLNQLSTEMQQHDSVIIYYAGHGYRNEKTGGGYWIPADASVSDPTSWISNSDVSKMLSDISAKQMVMISDSCYSGTFAEEKLGLNVAGIKPDEVLAKRSVIVMSSGGDEPVADEGREGHSIFAWDLMQALRGVDNWQSGTTVFEQVKREVMKSFPQTPQYGTVKSAGHEAGGEYLFEFRQLE